MKTKFLLMAISALLLAGTAHAQETTPAKERKIKIQELGRYRFTIQPLQLTSNELSLNAEKMWGRRSVGLLAAYGFKGNRVPFNLDFDDPDYTVDYKSALLGVNSKYYFSRSKRWFYEGQLFYRQWWHRADYSGISSTGDYYESHTVRKFHVYGLKVLLGYSTTFTHSGRVRPYISLYTGLGVRAKHETYKNTHLTNGTPDPSAAYDKTKLLPTFHLGFTLGIEIFDKALPKQP